MTNMTPANMPTASYLTVSGSSETSIDVPATATPGAPISLTETFAPTKTSRRGGLFQRRTEEEAAASAPKSTSWYARPKVRLYGWSALGAGILALLVFGVIRLLRGPRSSSSSPK